MVVNEHLKKESPHSYEGSQSVNFVVTQTSVEFYHLHVDTSFSSIYHKLSMFDTDL